MRQLYQPYAQTELKIISVHQINLNVRQILTTDKTKPNTIIKIQTTKNNKG